MAAMPAAMGSLVFKRMISMFLCRISSRPMSWYLQALFTSGCYPPQSWFIERFYCIAIEDPAPTHGRYEKCPIKACALLMTSADDNFWTYDKALDYYRYNLIDYLDTEDKGCLLAGGCGDTNGKPQIAQTGWLEKGYEFGKRIMNQGHR